MTTDTLLSFDLQHPTIPLEGTTPSAENAKRIMESLATTPLEGIVPSVTGAQQMMEELAIKPLEGKQKPAPGEQKRAIICWGPPGSGKTTQGHALIAQRRETEHFVTICYDEKGALYSIPAYKREHDDLETKRLEILREEPFSQAKLDENFGKRLDLYRKHRGDSQRIRSLTFNEAVEQGHNLFIDIVGAGKGAVKMMEALKEQGYEIEVVGRLASLGTAVERINNRGTKVIEPDDIHDKRIGAYNSLPDMIKAADTFSLYLNDRQESQDVSQQHPTAAIRTQDGVSFWTSPAAKAEWEAILQKDREDFAKRPDAAEAIDAADAALQELPVIRQTQRGTGTEWIR